MRHVPRPLTGILAFLGYLVVFYGVWIATGIDYNHISDNTGTVLKWYVAPLLAGAVFLVIVVSILRWWRPAIQEVRRAAPTWLLIGPVFMALAAVATIATKDLSQVTVALLGLVVLGSVLVGFCEELATRGQLIVGLRGKYSEPMVWLWSTLMFGLLHLPNWAFGAGPAAVLQVFLAFGGGTMFYLTRRLTGSLVFAMLLHGLWDFASFIGESDSLLPVLFTLVNGILALVLVAILLRKEKGLHMPQAGVEEAPEAVPAAA